MHAIDDGVYDDGEQLPVAHAAFQSAYPGFEATRILDELRAREYAQLDEQGHIYLDYTGSGLYAASQIREYAALVAGGVFGNPHSTNPTSQASSRLVAEARAAVLAFFRAAPDEYTVIFTPNASGALKLLGEAYPFETGSQYLLTFDNHNSVNGIREFAWAKGATVTYAPIVAPELRADENALVTLLDRATPGHPHLFAYPAQSNFSGVQHPLDWIARAQERGWHVLLDAAAYVPANRLDLGRWHPDFVSLSFYKMFGFPTGVGCLLARKESLARLRRPWFAGGTISIASVQGRGWHYLLPDAAGFEDGTLNYLGLPGVTIGLRFLSGVGLDTIHQRVRCLTGWLLDTMGALRHSDGAPLVRLYGPRDLRERGATIAFNLIDAQGRPHDYHHIEALAAEARISLRTGCFCNPGAGEVAHNVTAEEMAQCFRGGHPLTFEQFFDHMRHAGAGKTPSTVRISVGLATTFADVHLFLRFIRRFLDRSTDAVAQAVPAAAHAAH